MQESVHKVPIFIHSLICFVFPFSPVCATIPREQANLAHVKYTVCHHHLPALGQFREVVEHEASPHLLNLKEATTY